MSIKFFNGSDVEWGGGGYSFVPVDDTYNVFASSSDDHPSRQKLRTSITGKLSRLL